MLCTVDKIKYPRLAEGIYKGKIFYTSMGVTTNKSYCSECKKACYTEEDWCSHLKYEKGRMSPRTGKIVFEINTQLMGLEDSLIHGSPSAVGADKEALIREIFASKENPQHPSDQFIRNMFAEFCDSTGLTTEEMIEYIKKLH
jgi:hypothetical protein